MFERDVVTTPIFGTEKACAASIEPAVARGCRAAARRRRGFDGLSVVRDEPDREGVAVSKKRRAALRRELMMHALFAVVFASVSVLLARLIWEAM